jgi:diadenylate cyclase
MTIFFPGTALHDGSVVIRDDKIVAAAVVLPLGGSMRTDTRLLGTRHRAALGITEITDAIAVVVSEETGRISVAHNGQLISGVDQKRLEQLLRAFYRAQLDGSLSNRFRTGQNILRRLGLVKSGNPAVQSQSKQ